MLNSVLDETRSVAVAGPAVERRLVADLATAVGVRELIWSDGTQEFQAAVWYPAARDTGIPTKYSGVFSARALLCAEPLGEGHPLVVISHGFGGNRYDQAFLAEHLAARGYVCLAVSHQDRAVEHRWRHLFDRPKFLVAALRHFQASDLARMADPDGTTLVAHSAGAYAVLIAAGAIPRFDLEPELSSARTLLEQFDPEPYRLDSVRAIVLMAPALSNLFDQTGLSSIHAPVLVLDAELDRERLLGTAQAYANLLGNARYHMIEGAGHYAFINEFPPLLAKLKPAAAGGDGHRRSALHATFFGLIDHLLAQAIQRPRISHVA